MKRDRITAAAIFIFTAIALIALCFVASDVFARAGGGGGYSGGGGGGGGGFGGGGFGGGGGGSGGGGGGNLIGLLIWLCFKHPLIGIPLVIGFVVLMYHSGKQGRNAYQGHVIRRGNEAAATIRNLEGVKTLNEVDAQFDEEKFLSRVATAFEKVQQAWSQQNLESMRHFVSDGLYERFSLQIAEQRDLDYRNVMENVRISRTQIAQVESDDPFDLVSIRIAAQAVDYRIRLSDEREIRGSRRDEFFVEYWTFLRRRGTQSGSGPGLIEGSCPNCGAAISVAQMAKCDSCDSLLRSGQYDWVLCEITQECEWRDPESRKIPGLAEFRRSHDPHFNVQQLEDRASVVFWRKVMADRLGEIGPLAKMATPAFCDAYAKQLTTDQPTRRYRGDCAVGAVVTAGILPGDDLDRALVEIHWSGKVFAVVAADGSRKQTSESAAYQHLFVFARRADVKTNVEQAVSSSHCPGCGAPESLLASDSCEFCGTVLNTGFHDWVLTEILPTFGNEAGELLRQATKQASVADAAASNGDGPSPGSDELLAWTLKIVAADNELDAKEKKMLRRVAENRNMPPRQMQMLLDAARRGELDAPEPRDRDQARDWLTAMADVSLWDGRVHPEEYKLLCQAGKKFDYSEYDIKALLKRRKKKLYDEARQRLRSSA